MLTREENITSEFSKNLSHTYEWFNTCFTKALSESFSEFWAKPVDVCLISISENTNILAQREEFFVTQIRLNKELSVFVRLSKQFVKNILEQTLGSNGKNFNMEKLTDLEAKILTSFDDFLYKTFSNCIKQSDSLPTNNNNYNECNLTFFLKEEDRTLGKIVIKLPVVAIAPEKILPGEDSFTIANFLSQKAEVKLKVGHTRLRLNDLKSIEVGDIVLLEQSQASVMTLTYKDYVTQFRVSPNPLIMIDEDFDDNGSIPKGEDMTGSDMYNMWDSIQVDIGAEFEKVKLTLGELKQISEGLVVDIGSVYDNKIDLKVENKIVASGELVIINDRYGVKVNQVFTEEETPVSQNVVPEEHFDDEVEFNEELIHQQIQEQEQPQEYESQNQMEEDFDYSDFDADEDDL